MKPLDHDRLADAVIRGAKRYIDVTLGPILKRLDDAEARATAAEGKLGDMVAAAVAAIPPAQPGKSVTVEDCAPFLLDAVAKAVGEAVAKIPAAKNGVGFADAIIDRKGALVLTKDDGSKVALGRVVGRSFTRDEIAAIVAEAVSAIPKPADGKSVDPRDLETMVVAEVAKAVAALPPAEPGEPGRSVDPAEIEAMVELAVAKLPKPEKGDPGEVDMNVLGEMVSQSVQRAVSALPRPKDGDPGKDADPETIRQMVAAAVAELPPAPAGKDADPDETAALVRDEVEKAVAAIPKPQDGRSVSVEELVPVIEERLPAIISEAVARIPVPKDGKSVDPIEIARMVDDKVTAIAATFTPKAAPRGMTDEEFALRVSICLGRPVRIAA